MSGERTADDVRAEIERLAHEEHVETEDANEHYRKAERLRSSRHRLEAELAQMESSDGRA